MMQWKKLATMVTAGALAMSCVGAMGVSAADTEKSGLEGKRIGISEISLYDEWCTGVYDEFKKQAEDWGVAEVNIQDGNYNIETQQKQIEDFISQKYDAIFIDVVESDAIKGTLDKAKEAGIPVLAFDSGTDWEDLITHVKWDHSETGRMTAEWVANYANENLGGKVRVGMLTNTTSAVTRVRGEAFKEKLEELLGADNIEYVFEQDFNEARENASNIVTNNIAKPIDVIWGAVDNAAFGAEVALENANNKDTVIVSSGGWGKEPFNALNDPDSHYKAVVAVPPAEIVRQSFETMSDYFNGVEDIPKEKDITLSIVDATNIADYIQYAE